MSDTPREQLTQQVTAEVFMYPEDHIESTRAVINEVLTHPVELLALLVETGILHPHIIEMDTPRAELIYRTNQGSTRQPSNQSVSSD